MLAKYCQKKLDLYKETGYDLEFAKVETLAKRKDDLQKHLEDRKKNLTLVEEWADHKLSNYTDGGGKGHRFGEPLTYVIVFIRDGTFAGSKNGPTIWTEQGQALSMK